MTTATRLNFNLSLVTLPKLYLYAAPPADVMALVKEILEEFYTDGIDQIVSAQLNEAGDIVGEFIDQVGARQVKRYKYQIQDNDVAFKLLNPNEAANFGIESFNPMFGKGAKAGQKKSCKKGTPCGGTCISGSKACRKAPGSTSKAKIAEAKQKLGGGSGGGVSPEPKGGALATKGGALTVRAIDEQRDAPRFKGDRAKEIDAKFANEDPSEVQVNQWLQSRIRNDFVDTPEAKARLTAQAIAEDLSKGEPSATQYARHIKDEESYVKARKSIDDAVFERSATEINGKTYRNDTEEYWLNQHNSFTQAFYGKPYEKAKKTVAGSKASEAGKKKAQKVIDKYEADLEDNKTLAKKHAAAVKARRADPSGFEAQSRADWAEGQKKHAPRIDAIVNGVKSREPSAMDNAATMIKNSVAPGEAGFFKSQKSVFRDHLISKAGIKGQIFGEVSNRAQLKAAFKDYATKNHPDKGGDTKKFQSVSQEYQRLLMEYP